MTNKMVVRSALAAVSLFCFTSSVSHAASDAEKNRSTEMNTAYYCDAFRVSRDIKIAFLGNSITLHNPKDSLGWTNRCGMAASSSAKDYVHLVADGVSRITSRGVDVRVKNLASFERDYRNRDVASDVGEIIAFKPDILVLALGENVPGLANEDDKRAYGAAFSRLLALFRKDTRSPFIVVRGVFWPNRAKDEAMEMAARENGAVFVKADISHDKRNMALGLFAHPGVARHPGDEGMAEIAKRILSPIEKELQSVPTPFKVYLDEAGAGSIGSVLFDFADGSLACGAKGFYRKSLDGGRTWKTMYPMAPGFGASRGSNIIRLKDGRLMCMINEPCENILTNSLKASNFYVSFSSDEGRTWKGRVPLSSDNRRLYLMNDRFVRLSTGRILVPFSLHPNELLAERLESVGWVNAFYSDDEGATWREGRRRPTKAADQMCEPVVFERKDGVLVMFARTGMGYLYRCESKDGGESWGEERPSPLRSAVSPFAMKKDPFTGWVFAAWNNSFPSPVHQYPRSPFSFAVSRDDGDTWEFICDIENDPMSSYGYPAIHFTEDSVLVVYYEQKGVRYFEHKAQRCKLAVFDRAGLTVEKRSRERLVPPPSRRTRAAGLKGEARRLYGEFAETDRALGEKKDARGDIPADAVIDYLLEHAPRFSCPDKAVETAFAYRFWALSKHFFTNEWGWCVSEFMDRRAIVCPVGHHLREGRWFGDRKVFDDYTRYWFRNGKKSPVNGHGSYVNWIVQGVLAREEATGDTALADSLLDGFIANYEAWEKGWEARPWPEEGMYRMGLGPDGLFRSIDDREGTELSLSGNGARVHVNAMMYGEAAGIAKIAARCGRTEVASAFSSRAERLARLIKEKLWNAELGFFTPMKDDGTLSPVCELHGYSPWYARVPLGPEYAKAWRYLDDGKKGFRAPFGLTFPVMSAPGFKILYSGHGCQWNGTSWPFATSIALTALADAIHAGNDVSADKDVWFRAFRGYALQHFQKMNDGKVVPWVDETYDPIAGSWYAYRRWGRTSMRAYNHSTFCDIVISGLVGLKVSRDGKITASPLVPPGWGFFRLENVPVRGRKVAVAYRDGRVTVEE